MKKVIRNKQFTRHFNEDYDDNVDALQNSLEFELTSDKPTLFVFDVNGETVLELTLDQITAILKANGYGSPIIQSSYTERRKVK